ncbi:unnamed protein product [Trichogramma brassicae]|uniref:Uncharacterized protein n=1 Tax=Trichogramma brassicae TaxID=86971 RepID=A0A6H5IHA4_9HYME|nr:unnamed protein product [Trichogramma brassicae]
MNRVNAIKKKKGTNENRRRKKAFKRVAPAVNQIEIFLYARWCTCLGKICCLRVPQQRQRWRRWLPSSVSNKPFFKIQSLISLLTAYEPTHGSGSRNLPFPIFSENHATRYNVPYAVRNVSLVTFTALSLKTVWDILAPVFNRHKQQLILNKTI